MAASVIAGLLSSGLFLLVSALGLGFFFLFLPTLPLLIAGFSNRPPITANRTFQGACIAAVIITVAAGAPAAILFLLFLGLPSWHIVRLGLLSTMDSKGGRAWFPIGTVFLHLTLWACAAVAAVTLYHAGKPGGGITGLLARHIRETFASLEGEYSDVIDLLATSWAFLIFPLTIWLWGLALYAHAWFALRLLNRNRKAVRPDMAIRPFFIPNWVLTLLAIAGLASVIGSESMRLLGKSTLISLMLPYFFQGAALMHEATKTWPNRRFFLFFVYFFTFAQFWPALFLSGVGLLHHIKCLSAPRGSTRN